MSEENSPTIWVESGSGQRTAHRLAMGARIVGRHPGVGVCLPVQDVSSHHAELYWDGERLRIRDLGSRNGTTVNREPVTDWTELRHGDVIRFSSVEAVVEIDSSVPASEGTPPGQSPPSRLPAPPPTSPRWQSDLRPAERPAGTRLSQVPIFISHSSEDKHAVRAIASYLVAAGWTAWIDEAGIEGGKDWRSELMQALEGTWVVVLVVSYHSMQSRWVLREIQAADRLGISVLPVMVDDAPYPDALRLILAGVQQIELWDMNDHERFNQSMGRLDRALILQAQQRGRTRPGTTRIAVGTVITVIGVIGVIIGFASFMYLGFTEDPPDATRDGGIPDPFIGWAVFAASIVVAGIGQGIRRSGMKKGI